MVGICKRGPSGAIGACTSPHSHKVTIMRFTCLVYMEDFSQKGISLESFFVNLAKLKATRHQIPQYCHIPHSRAKYVARGDHTRPHVTASTQPYNIIGPLWQSARPKQGLKHYPVPSRISFLQGKSLPVESSLLFYLLPYWCSIVYRIETNRNI